MAGFFLLYWLSDQQPGRPLAEPVPQPVVFGTTTGEPEMLGTWGREAAFGLDGLTAPGVAG